ncbi:uncharacterized protein LOC132349759 isoform X1 [Balaenoptera ricei]|uniref:uncharacterized protein LOC132349759 isoform X1 n=1 Tax=Balaenoptera ricei TaxID=2746895 RepID=UPI0028BE1DC2|nr:uncharacterized protein LOC132349759 isoform X1 [Balaenoptera ricei]
MITWLRCFQDPPMRLPRGPQALQLAQQYGPAFTVHLGRQKTVVLTGYEAVREALLGTGQELAGRPPIVIFQLIQGGGGIFFSSGARWRAARRLTTRTLHGLGVGRAPVADKVLQEPRCLTAQLHSDGGLAPGHTASAPNHKRTLQNRHTGCGLSSRVCRDFDWRRSSVSPEPNGVARPPPTSQGKPVVGESTLGAGVLARASNFPRPLCLSFLPAARGRHIRDTLAGHRILTGPTGHAQHQFTQSGREPPGGAEAAESPHPTGEANRKHLLLGHKRYSYWLHDGGFLGGPGCRGLRLRQARELDRNPESPASPRQPHPDPSRCRDRWPDGRPGRQQQVGELHPPPQGGAPQPTAGRRAGEPRTRVRPPGSDSPHQLAPGAIRVPPLTAQGPQEPPGS